MTTKRDWTATVASATLGAAVLVSATVCAIAARGQNEPVSSRAKAVHNSAIVVDLHEDTAQRFLDDHYDIGSTDAKDVDYLSLDKAHAGNLAAEFFSIWVDPKANQGHYARRALELIDSVYEQAARHPERMMMAFSAEDIERAHKEGKFAALMGIEGGHSIENSLRLLDNFYRLGVRYMTLTWSNGNDWADSSGDIDDPNIPHHNGLTALGKQVVREMNRLGMMVDVSHVSDKTFWDVIETSKAPVIASHSSARGLTHVSRNMSDDMLRAVAKTGGLVGVNFFATFLDENYLHMAEAQHREMLKGIEDYVAKRKAAGAATTEEERERFAREWLGKNRVPRVPLKSLIDHIDHVAKVAGVEHVGLGSDFDGRDYLPEGIDTAADLPKITEELLDRNYSPEEIKKILGGNLLRVFREVTEVSRRMQRER